MLSILLSLLTVTAEDLKLEVDELIDFILLTLISSIFLLVRASVISFTWLLMIFVKSLQDVVKDFPCFSQLKNFQLKYLGSISSNLRAHRKAKIC